MLLATGPFSSTLSILQSSVHKFLSSANMRSKPKGKPRQRPVASRRHCCKTQDQGIPKVFLARGKKRSSSGNPALRSGIPLASNSPTARRQHLVIPNYAAVWHPQVACSEPLHLACRVPVTSRTSPKHIPWKPERVCYVKLFVALSAKCEKMKTVKPPRKSKQPTCIGLPVGMQRHHICTPRNLPTTAEQEPGPLHCRYDVEKIEHRNVKLEPVMVYRLFSRFVAICNAVLKDSIHCASMELSQTVEPLRIQFKLQKCTCRVRAKACPSQTEELYMLG